MGDANRSIYQGIWFPLRLAFLMVLFFLVTHYLNLDLNFLGNRPRSLMGLAGILFAPLLHVSWIHLLSNVSPLLFLGTLAYWFYSSVIAQPVFLRCYFLPSVLVWLFAKGDLHVGASGMIYGLVVMVVGMVIYKYQSLFDIEFTT